MKNILITGHRGMIGTVLWKGLASKYHLLGLDRDEADIADLNRVTGFWGSLPPLAAVVHLAADPYPFAAFERVHRDNVCGTRNIYEACRRFGVPKVIFASSAHVVGGYPGYPQKLRGQDLIKTDEPVRPDGWYGWSKAAGEIMARLYADTYGISSVCLRIGHVTKNDDNSETNLKKLFLSSADMVQIAEKSLESEVTFGIFFVTSKIARPILDLSNAISQLGYVPH